MFKTMAAVVLVAAWAVVGGIMLTMVIDPGCGPDGNSQKECMAEMVHDITAMVTK